MISKRCPKDLRCYKKWSVIEISQMSWKSYFWDIFKGPGFESQSGQTEKKTKKNFLFHHCKSTTLSQLFTLHAPTTLVQTRFEPTAYWSAASTTAPLFHVKYEWLNDAFIISFVLLMCFNSFTARAGIIFRNQIK